MHSKLQPLLLVDKQLEGLTSLQPQLYKGLMNTHPLQKAIDLAGSQSELARRVGVKQQHVWKWLNRNKRGVPGEYVIPIEEATGVSRHELRPDLYPPSDTTENKNGSGRHGAPAAE